MSIWSLTRPLVAQNGILELFRHSGQSKLPSTRIRVHVRSWMISIGISGTFSMSLYFGVSPARKTYLHCSQCTAPCLLLPRSLRSTRRSAARLVLLPSTACVPRMCPLASALLTRIPFAYILSPVSSSFLFFDPRLIATLHCCDPNQRCTILNP